MWGQASRTAGPSPQRLRQAKVSSHDGRDVLTGRNPNLNGLSEGTHHHSLHVLLAKASDEASPDAWDGKTDSTSGQEERQNHNRNACGRRTAQLPGGHNRNHLPEVVFHWEYFKIHSILYFYSTEVLFIARCQVQRHQRQLPSALPKHLDSLFPSDFPFISLISSHPPSPAPLTP